MIIIDRQEIIKVEKELLYDEDKYLQDFLEENHPYPMVSHKEIQRILHEPITEDTKEKQAINVIKKGKVKEREWNTVADIFQRAIKRNKLTEEQVLQQCKEILKEVREERKWKDSKNIRKELNLTNKEIKEMLMKNFKLDKQERPIISKDDEWYYEDYSTKEIINAIKKCNNKYAKAMNTLAKM